MYSLYELFFLGTTGLLAGLFTYMMVQVKRQDRTRPPPEGGSMKSLLLLWKCAADELAARCRTSTSHDYELVVARTEHEGVSFLTITLPSFCKSLEKGLAVGKVERSDFPSFTWRAGLPRFLGGFLALVFDRETGCLLDDPDVEALYAIRQLTLMFGKIGLKCTPAREAAAMSGFVDIEREVRKLDAERTEVDYLEFSRMSRLLWVDAFTTVDKKIYDGDIIPKHGPGATADRLRGNAKFNLRQWTERLERMFPYLEYALPNDRHYKCLDRVEFLTPEQERPVRVIAVPKTLKTPRIIAIEPTCMQYMQQAVSRSLVEQLESSDSDFGWLVGFTDQEPNQLLAREGSLTGALATLDLSEASDRVSNQLVRVMFRNHFWLDHGVDACRSRKADVDGHGVLRLAKFASMGSALTFPVEAMVFATVVMLGVEKSRGRRFTRKSAMEMRGRVRVYGDDIIVPADSVQCVLQELRTFGFKVNLDKSFWTGKFRESCGKEYYNGHDVSVVRVRDLLPTKRTAVHEVISAVSLRNRCYMAGLWSTAAYLDAELERILHHFPTVDPGSSILGRWSLFEYETQRVHPTLHSPLVKGYKVRSRLPDSHLEDVGALMKVLLSTAENEELQDLFLLLLKGGLPAADLEHLERAGRPQAVDIKLGWDSPF